MAWFILVQPWGTGADRLGTATVVSEHATAAEAFAELERYGRRMLEQGIQLDALELYVVDEERRTSLAVLNSPTVRLP